MIRIVAAFLLLALSLAANAESEQPFAVTIAECGEGGCSCYDSELTIPDIEVVLGASMPDGVERPIVVDDGSGLFWSEVSLEDIETIYGGDGTCSQAQSLQPEDGIWSRQSRFIFLTCGPATQMMRSMMEPHLNDEIPPRVIWDGVFDGSVYLRAWISTNPDPEQVVVPFRQTSATVSEGAASLRGESATMHHAYHLELLSPRLFRADWRVTAQVRGQPCNWHIRSMIRKIAD
jgi:hypothetical protein